MKKHREGIKREFPGTELVEKAITICCEAHKGQLRKGDGKMYFIHPIMVALKLARYGASDEVIAAALAHDVLEDTDYSKSTLREELGDIVLEMIEALTQDDSLFWREKKSKYIETVRNASMDVKLISAADKIHNVESLIMAHKEQGEALWKKFNCGREDKKWFENELLDVFKKYSHPLFDEYESLVEKVKRLD